MSDLDGFFDDAEDDDEFVEPVGRVDGLHAIDGSVCIKCGYAHEIRGYSSEVPPEIHRSLSRYLDKMPEDMRRVTAILIERRDSNDPPPIADVLMRVSRSFFAPERIGPTMMAIRDVLDRQTDGVLGQQVAVYRAGGQLAAAHGIRRACRSILTECQTGSLKTKSTDVHSFLQALIAFIHMVDDVITINQKRYRDACTTAGREPDASILERGLPAGTDEHYDEDGLQGFINQTLSSLGTVSDLSTFDRL